MSKDVVETVDGIQQSATTSLQLSCKKQYTDRVLDANQICIEVGFERTVTRLYFTVLVKLPKWQ